MATQSPKVLITGADGHLGKVCCEMLSSLDYHVIACHKKDVDIKDESQVIEACLAHQPHIIIHTAAFTDVDRAEVEPEEAYRVNAYGARHMALAAKTIGAKLVHLSTDQVFQGTSEQPYKEMDYALPVNVYGASKLAGERFIQAIHEEHFIIRTAWLFGADAVEIEIDRYSSASPSSLWNLQYDTIACPTYIPDLVSYMMMLMETTHYGLYHMTNSGYGSKTDFMQAIESQIARPVYMEHSKDDFRAEPSRYARQPSHLVLASTALKRIGLAPLRDWREALTSWVKDS
ncbi:dTDP-4-dehydrorhamnose reductase [Paenibacillus selenitireducens]|uniref:dTDP-4-dehydrorhamnose reductase n=1 Tax=Paenibacillus selenitireducens TaxID=1324314 RepID=A0A1T2X2L6_9BACL|nr:dTDP-4-dehydrorhamnose reductase [Paenibacillus selenitireducens]OPA74099.1 dTDP-4-dehydrorhamnose reductase [Paenibacillus selenitireducens]